MENEGFWKPQWKNFMLKPEILTTANLPWAMAMTCGGFKNGLRLKYTFQNCLYVWLSLTIPVAFAIDFHVNVSASLYSVSNWMGDVIMAADQRWRRTSTDALEGKIDIETDIEYAEKEQTSAKVSLQVKFKAMWFNFDVWST